MSAQPDYVSFDQKGRDELLSQIGSFAPEERALFHRLCDAWSTRMDAKQFLETSTSSEANQRTALERLMAKLRTAQIGVLTTTNGPEGREPDQIILTTRDSLLFWTGVVEEAIMRGLRSSDRLLPTERRLRDQRALPPDYHVVEGDTSHLVESYHGRCEPSTIYRIRLMGNFRIYFTPGVTKDLVLHGLSTLKRELVERGIVEELARVRNTGISDVVQRLDSKAPDIWLDLTHTLVGERAAIAYRKNIDEADELFQLAYFIMIFVDAQIGVARERRRHEQLVSQELETLVAAVRSAPAGALAHEEFSTLVEDALARAGAAGSILSTRLGQELLSPRSRRALPVLLYLEGHYIHESRVGSLFSTSRSRMSGLLSREYSDLMEAFLRGRLPQTGEIFGSRETLNSDIARRVARADPILDELLSRPQLLAEAIILEAKQRRPGISGDELKGILASCFRIDASALKQLCELFELDIVAIFDQAFARSGVLRQLLLRISGRYESLRGTYSRRFGSPSLRRSTGTLGGQAERANDQAAVADTSGNRDLRTEAGVPGEGDRTDTVAGRRRLAASRRTRSRTKSRAEIEQMWREFDRALHTNSSEDELP